MKKMGVSYCGLLAGLMLSATAQAAPISYQLETSFFVEMYHKPNEAGTIVGFNGSSFPAGRNFSLSFDYDSSVALTPLDLPPASAGAAYIDRFDAAGAFTHVQATLGNYQFGSDALYSQSWSYTTPNMVPTDRVYTAVGAVGVTAGANGSDSWGTYGGQNFKLTYISLTFGGGPTSDVLPSGLFPIGGGTSLVQLDFVADDGSVVSASYFGGVREVPVPAAIWLFGSSLLAPVALRLRSKV